ncbi:putative MIT domain-containing protein 1, partial [Hypsibius exemplaris]
ISDPAVRNQLKAKAEEYIARAEHLKKIVEDEKKKNEGYHEQIIIEEDAVGFGLEKVFLQYLDQNLTEVEIDDPYIRANHQIQNFLRFCAVLVKHARNVVTIRLRTTRDPKPESRQNQLTRLDDIRIGLLERKINLFVEYCDTLHDREI